MKLRKLRRDLTVRRLLLPLVLVSITLVPSTPMLAQVNRQPRDPEQEDYRPQNDPLVFQENVYRALDLSESLGKTRSSRGGGFRRAFRSIGFQGIESEPTHGEA